jgi:hypothetical protein
LARHRLAEVPEHWRQQQRRRRTTNDGDSHDGIEFQSVCKVRFCRRIRPNRRRTSSYNPRKEKDNRLINLVLDKRGAHLCNVCPCPPIHYWMDARIPGLATLHTTIVRYGTPLQRFHVVAATAVPRLISGNAGIMDSWMIRGLVGSMCQCTLTTRTSIFFFLSLVSVPLDTLSSLFHATLGSEIGSLLLVWYMVPYLHTLRLLSLIATDDLFWMSARPTCFCFLT